MWLELKYLEANVGRGFVGWLSFILMVIGAWLIWDWKVAIFVLGLIMYIECSTDEIVERMTLTKRKAK